MLPGIEPKDPASRGAVIAFVGSEAAGKTTIVGAVHDWLRDAFEVQVIHAGKPPRTRLTAVPHLLLPGLRILFPNDRSTIVQARYEKADEGVHKAYSLLFALRAVMLAYERRALLAHASAAAARGAVVLSDRYPSSGSGTADGPQMADRPAPTGRISLRRALCRLESRVYRRIPGPDLVIELTSPLEVTLARNAARAKREPEDYVRLRHSIASRVRFENVTVHRIDTNLPLASVLSEVRRVVQDFLRIQVGSRT